MGYASCDFFSCPAPPILSVILGAEPSLNNLSKFRGPPHKKDITLRFLMILHLAKSIISTGYSTIRISG